MRILECPPSDEAGYIDEADQFYRNPTLWLSEKYGLSSGHQDQLQFPTHIVLYNVLLPVSWSFYHLNYLSDYHLNSPYIINPESHINVMRIIQMITN